MSVRHKARAILLDGDQLVLMRREWPGADPYCTTIGGSVDPGDASAEDALRREVMEEIGATIGPAAEVLTVTEPGVIHHFFLAELEEMDLARRCGPEFDDPDRGSYDPVRVPLTPAAVLAAGLRPDEIARFIAGHAEQWRDRRRNPFPL